MRALGENAEAKVRLWAAVKGYEMRQLSTGAAAELAGLPIAEFLKTLGRFGISVLEDLTAEEIEQEAEMAGRASRR
jgi:predicted HTH domain antitoxin